MNGFYRLLALLLGLSAALHAASPLTTRVFKIAPDFFIMGERPSGGAVPADPFAAGVPDAPQNQPPRKSAKEILEAQGITFPEGATATFDPTTSLLTVTNSQPNLDLVAAFIEETARQSPKTIAYTLTVIAGPGELIRQANAAASKTANANPQLAQLLDHSKKSGSNVRVVGDAFLETKSGSRTFTEAVREHIYASAMELDAKSRASVAQEMRPLGLRLEIDPTLGADGITIESTVSIELHPAQAIERQLSITEPITGNAAEFPSTDIFGAHFTTSITSTSGGTKLIGVTKPVGTPAEQEDILWAAFLTATVRQMEALPFTQPVSDAQKMQITQPGLSAAVFHVPDGLFANAMEAPMPLLKWFETQGILPAAGAKAVHEHGVLQILNTQDNIERIAALIDEYLNQCAHTVAFTLHTVQAPAAFLRSLAHRAAATSDQTALWASLAAATDRGEASFINSVFLETKSGNRATHEAVREHVYLSEFGTNAKGLPHLAFEMRQVGSIFQVEPVVGADGHTIELTFDYELHAAPPEARRDHFLDPASKQRFDMPVSDFHTTKTSTGITLMKGGTQLISLHQPTGRNVPGMLWATFLKCDVVSQVAEMRHVSKEPAPTSKASVNPKAWDTRRYGVPPDFLSAGAEVTTDGQKRYKTAKMILESAGITFPEGASAIFNPASSILTIKNTNENLDLIEAFLSSILWDPTVSAVFTTHILQGPGPLLRRLTVQAASKSDHHAELDELLAAVKAGTVQHLNTARIETKSGTRALTQQVREHNAISDVSLNDKDEPVFAQEMRGVGLRLELEPTVGADGVTVELNIAPEFHTAEPFEHREHVIAPQGRHLEFPLTDYHSAKVTTAITLPDGTTRLLSLYKPTGKPEFDKEDILQAIFITCDILRSGE